MLISTDFSEAAQRALRSATVMARRYSSVIHLCHVDEERALGMHSSDDLIRFMNQVDARRREWMEQMAADLEEEGFEVRLVRLEGVASEQMLDYAAKEGIGLMVLGTVGHTTLSNLLLGSTSRAILRSARCPVLTMNTKEDDEEWQVRRVLFPTDLSRASVDGLHIVADVTRRFDAELHILHVLKAPTYIPAMPGEPPFYVSGQAFDVARDRSAADLHALATRPELEGIAVTTDVRLAGDTADGITTYVDDTGCDLVVIPRHGRSGIRHMIFGRVVQHVVKTAGVPVLSFVPPAVG